MLRVLDPPCEVVSPPDLALDVSALNDLIDRQLRDYADLGRSFTWQVHAHDHPDVGSRVLDLGFSIQRAQPLLGARVGDVLQSAISPLGGAVPRNVSSGEELELVAQMHAEVGARQGLWAWDPAALASRLSAMLSDDPPSTGIFAVNCEGQLIASAWVTIDLTSELAELAGAVTIPSSRGRGVFSSLVRARARFAQDHGVSFVYAEASPQSQGPLQRLVLRVVSVFTVLVWDSWVCLLLLR